MTQSEAFKLLASELKEIDALNGIDAILGWDELVVMKEKSAGSRAAQKSALASVIHQRQTSDKLGQLIMDAEQETAGLGDFERASVRDARLRWDRKTKMPAELAKLEARLGSEGYQAWAKARENDDYDSFKPVLAKIVQLRKDEAAAVAPEKLPYDHQIDKFERGMSAERLAEIFEAVKAGLVPLIQEVTSAQQLVVDSRLAGGDAAPTFDVDKQVRSHPLAHKARRSSQAQAPWRPFNPLARTNARIRPHSLCRSHLRTDFLPPLCLPHLLCRKPCAPK